MANNRVEVLRMPFHYSFTVERWYRDYSSVLIAQKSCRPFYILARVRSRPYSCSIFSRASAHDRIPLDEVEVRDGNVPVMYDQSQRRLDMTQYYIIITRIFDESATLRP